MTSFVLGVGFLVVMAILVMMLNKEGSDRLGFVQTSFLGVVSWQFILVSTTPALGYCCYFKYLKVKLN